MAHFGILCPAAIGHLNPMCVLGRELQRREHAVTLIGVPDVEVQIAKSGLNFQSVGDEVCPVGTMEQVYRQLGQLSGLEGLRFTLESMRQETQFLFAEVPTVLKSIKVDALLVDQATLAGETISQYLELPYITICNALPVNQEPGVPPWFTAWDYNPSWWAQLRNRAGNFLVQLLSGPLVNQVNQQRQQWGLVPYKSFDEFGSPLAQISQLPKDFDFPRQQLVEWFHYTGPLQDPSRLEPVASAVQFPWERLDASKPLIYASLGTLQNQKFDIFQAIATACSQLDVQLVISLGTPNQHHLPVELEGAPIVVPYAPHQQLIERSQLVITHAGMNTTLVALSCGKPLVAIPITNEQPGIAARIAKTGAGDVISLSALTPSKLRDTIRRVLDEPAYKNHALKLQAAIVQAGGVTRAADIIEQAVMTQKPVLASDSTSPITKGN